MLTFNYHGGKMEHATKKKYFPPTLTHQGTVNDQTLGGGTDVNCYCADAGSFTTYDKCH